MKFYAALVVISWMTALLTGFIYWKTREVSFVLGIGFLYYWSILGGWLILADKLSHASTRYYGLLEERLFSVAIDDNYFLTLVLYGLFILVVTSTVLFTVRGTRLGRQAYPKKLRLSHWVLILLSGMCGAASLFLIREALGQAWHENLAAYALLSELGAEASGTYTLHQFLLRASLLGFALGMAVVASGREGRRIVSRRGGAVIWLAYAVCVTFMVGMAAILGQKSEVLFAGLAGLLLYIKNARLPRMGLMLASIAMGVFLLGGINLYRSTALPKLLEIGQRWDSTQLVKAAEMILSSNEPFAAHFSMYGVLKHEIAPAGGTSVVSLMASFVPRAVWPARPQSVYEYYAGRVLAVRGQGYTLHHATGWYLNFGTVGVILGAACMGLLWAMLYNGFMTSEGTSSRVRLAFTAVCPWTFVANIPILIRGGIEGYKGVLFNTILVPVALILLANIRIRWVARETAEGGGMKPHSI